jgi:hypothetical protein
MDLQATLAVSLIGRGQAPAWREACPLRQLQKTHGGVGALLYLPPEQHAKLRPRQV